MSKVAQYLQEHLLGEVTDNLEIRRYFSHDASILRLVPSIIVYPRNESDVRKTARFAWQLAERGRILPITARGGGSNTSGAALGSGILLVFTAHMNRILALDPKKEILVVEPGAVYNKVEQTLFTHNLFLPPYPASQNYSTIGGGIASDTVGEKSVKYGPTRDYVDRLRVVLSNGEIIETGPLTKRELNHKLGLATFEGKIYRELDSLIEDNAELIEQERTRVQAPHNAVGYKLIDVKKDKHFDLTPLFVGSQGTLGIITEATMRVVPHTPASRVAVVTLGKLEDLDEVLPKILELKPSVCEMINKAAIELVHKLNPNQLIGTLDRFDSEIHLFVEFDNHKESDQKQALKRLKKITDKAGGDFRMANNPDELNMIRKLRESTATILTHPLGEARAIPAAEDICVPPKSLSIFLRKAAEIYGEHGLPAAAWGSAGSGIVRMQPLMNLSSVGDRQKLFKLIDSLYRAAIEMGGSLSGAAGDGRTRAPYAFWQYTPEYYELIMRVKQIFDPQGILNPGVKTAKLDEIKSLLRNEYNLSHHEHLPRS